jgi:hypothetical protein
MTCTIGVVKFPGMLAMPIPRLRYLFLSLSLLAPACGCSSVRDAVAVAQPYADPLLRALGFCKEHASSVARPDRVDRALAAYKDGDKVTALLLGAEIMRDLEEAGVEIPQNTSMDLVRTLAAIEGMQQGLRALHGGG